MPSQPPYTSPLPDMPSARPALLALAVGLAAAASAVLAMAAPGTLPGIVPLFAAMALVLALVGLASPVPQRLRWAAGTGLAGFGLLVCMHALVTLPGHVAAGDLPATSAARAAVALMSAGFLVLAAIATIRWARLRRRPPAGPLAPIGYR